MEEILIPFLPIFLNTHSHKKIALTKLSSDTIICDEYYYAVNVIYLLLIMYQRKLGGRCNGSDPHFNIFEYTFSDKNIRFSDTALFFLNCVASIIAKNIIFVAKFLLGKIA